MPGKKLQSNEAHNKPECDATSKNQCATTIHWFTSNTEGSTKRATATIKGGRGRTAPLQRKVKRATARKRDNQHHTNEKTRESSTTQNGKTRVPPKKGRRGRRGPAQQGRKARLDPRVKEGKKSFRHYASMRQAWARVCVCVCVIGCCWVLLASLGVLFYTQKRPQSSVSACVCSVSAAVHDQPGHDRTVVPSAQPPLSRSSPTCGQHLASQGCFVPGGRQGHTPGGVTILWWFFCFRNK